MWMTDYVREVKRQLRDVYGIKPIPGQSTEAEPVFADWDVPDGIYPMTIEGKLEHPVVSNGRFHLCLPLMDPATFKAGRRPKEGEVRP